METHQALRDTRLQLQQTSASHEKMVFFFHVMNPLLTKLVRSRWLNFGFILLFCVDGPRLGPHPLTCKKKTWLISSNLDLVIGQ